MESDAGYVVVVLDRVGDGIGVGPHVWVVVDLVVRRVSYPQGLESTSALRVVGYEVQAGLGRG